MGTVLFIGIFLLYHFRRGDVKEIKKGKNVSNRAKGLFLCGMLAILCIVTKNGGENGMTEHVFANQLKQLRKKRGISQSALAKVLHVSRSCIANYEKGDRQPDIEGVRRLADFFCVTIDFLYGHTAVSEPVVQEPPQTKLDITALAPEDRVALLSFYRFVCEASPSQK